MRIATMLAGLVLAATTPVSAGTSTPPAGRACSFASVTDPTVENGETQTGQVNGGPLAAPESAVSMRCAIHVGNGTHAGTAAVSASAGPERDVVALAPTPVSYLSPEGQPVYLCTQATVDGTTWYRDGDTWTANSSSSCALAISQEIFPGPLQPVLDLIDQLNCQDPCICEWLQILFPPEGDIPGIFDCPPYEGDPR